MTKLVPALAPAFWLADERSRMRSWCAALYAALWLFSCAPRTEPRAVAEAIPAPLPDAATAKVTTSADGGTSPAVIIDASTPFDDVIHTRFGARCHLERTCGALWGIDCEAAVDGPYFYVKAETLERVSLCGGACMGGRCTNCPPREWTCSVY